MNLRTVGPVIGTKIIGTLEVVEAIPVGRQERNTGDEVCNKVVIVSHVRSFPSAPKMICIKVVPVLVVIFWVVEEP